MLPVYTDSSVIFSTKSNRVKVRTIDRRGT